MTQQRAERWIYAAEALVLGLPALAVCLLMLMLLTLVVFFGTGEFSRSDLLEIQLLLVAGVIGIAAWTVISGHYLLDGKRAITALHGGWWIGLLLGVLLALLLNLSTLWDLEAARKSPWQSWCSLPLLIPACHLLILRLRK